VKTLPCGHISHSQNEEGRWASTEFKAETQRQKALCDDLVEQLKNKGSLAPGPYPPYPYTNETVRIYEVKQHFSRLKRSLPRRTYLLQVSIYEQALHKFFDLPPCRRDQSPPILPSKVKDLLQPSDLLTPRTGGRSPSQTIRQRNARIAELVRQRMRHQVICRSLDDEKWSVPQSWKLQEIHTWKQAYKLNRPSVHSLISKIATKR